MTRHAASLSVAVLLITGCHTSTGDTSLRKQEPLVGQEQRVAVSRTESNIAPISEVKLAATNLLRKLDTNRANFDIENIVAGAVEKGTLPTSFGVNFRQGGFVLLAADKNTHPILGYSKIGSIDTGNLNPAFLDYMADLNAALHEARMLSAEAKHAKDAEHYDTFLGAEDEWAELLDSSLVPQIGTAVEPMITSTWGQGDPYWRSAPQEEDGSQTMVGCGAVALGQILRFHEYPDHGMRSHEYTWKPYPDSDYQQTLGLEFSKTSWNWDLMPNSLGGPEVTDEQKEETARFLYEAAVAVSMRFTRGNSWSGTTNNERAFREFLRYPASVHLIHRYRYDDQRWVSRLREEMEEARPVFYRGGNNSGGGHFFILDGVDASNLFHINWGWNGSSDGYFTLLPPGPGAYGIGNSAVVGIAPSAAELGEECGGWGGDPCVQGLSCKNKGQDLRGTCQNMDWCHPTTVLADCADLEPDPSASDGQWNCFNNQCTYDDLTGGSAEDITESYQNTVSEGGWHHYAPYTVPAGGNLSVQLNPGSGDPDLYVNEGTAVSNSSGNGVDCVSWNSGTAAESCTLFGPGVYHVSVYGWGNGSSWGSPNSSFEITISYTKTGSQPKLPECGNGVIEPGEACDGSLACAALDPLSFSSGTAVCSSACGEFDLNACGYPSCGDGTKKFPAEQCDRVEPDGASETIDCRELSDIYLSGSASCNLTTCQYNIYSCNTFICGNDVVEYGEICDRNTKPCIEIDPEEYRGGAATCYDSCFGWDKSNCERLPRCGNEMIEVVDGLQEVCDNNYLSCTELNPDWYTGGQAACNSTCDGYIRSRCEGGFCGNGFEELNEKCDFGQVGQIPCAEYGPGRFTGGMVHCRDGCVNIDVSECTTSTCGNGQTTGEEVCDGNDASTREINCIEIDPLYHSGTATCFSTCDGYSKEYCQYCGDGAQNGAEICEQGQTIACTELSGDYAGGEATCYDTCDGWEKDNCQTNGPVLTTAEESGQLAYHAWAHYGPFESATGSFDVSMSGTGDADLYVNQGSRPSLSTYDCRPWKDGSIETCRLDGPGTFYVSVYGYKASSYELMIKYYQTGTPVSFCGDNIVDIGEQCDGNTSPCTDLSGDYSAGSATCNSSCTWNTESCVLAPSCGDGQVNGEEVCEPGQTISCTQLDNRYIGGVAACKNDCSGFEENTCTTGTVTISRSGTVARGEWNLFPESDLFSAASGDFTVAMSGSGDADLYVWKDKTRDQLTTTNYLCRPYDDGSVEQCNLSGPGTFIVGINGYATASNYSLNITYTP